MADRRAADGARQLNVGNHPLLLLHYSYSQWKLQRNATQGLPIGTNARRKAVAAPFHHCRLATQLLIPPSLRPNLSLDLPLPTLLCSQPCQTALYPRDRSPRQALPLAADQTEPKGARGKPEGAKGNTTCAPCAAGRQTLPPFLALPNRLPSSIAPSPKQSVHETPLPRIP